MPLTKSAEQGFDLRAALARLHAQELLETAHPDQRHRPPTLGPRCAPAGSTCRASNADGGQRADLANARRQWLSHGSVPAPAVAVVAASTIGTELVVRPVWRMSVLCAVRAISSPWAKVCGGKCQNFPLSLGARAMAALGQTRPAPFAEQRSSNLPPSSHLLPRRSGIAAERVLVLEWGCLQPNRARHCEPGSVALG